MSEVRSVTAAVSFAERIFTAKPVEAEPDAEDLAVYAEVQYNVADDGNIHLVIPQRVALAQLQQRTGAKRAAYFTVKAEAVDLVITRPAATEGEEEESALRTEPVEFELKLKFKE